MALRKHKNYSPEDLSAALTLTSLTADVKRQRPVDLEDDRSEQPKKKLATDAMASSAKVNNMAKHAVGSPKQWVLKPAPYFYYNDRSREPDDDPLTLLTPPGLVPTFPAKMHAILSNKELSDIIEWLPHGRAWRILKPRDFEVHVLPKYFHHNKLSSFVRQTNGWGFRRLTQGYDRNAYYHELFLKDLPHLSKKMMRPKVAEKKSVDPDHEPDLYAISKEFPLPFAQVENMSVSNQSLLPNPLTLMYSALDNGMSFSWK